MDMVLCVIDHKNNVVNFAGAMNPLYVVKSENEIKKAGDSPSPSHSRLEVIEGDIQSIGGMALKSDKNGIREFTNHDIPICKNMTIYMFSDGYIDQFGGENRKKFGSQRFRQLLLDNQEVDMQQQKASLIKTMEDWRTHSNQEVGSYEQIDDMLVVGVRF